jgi:hypothetical protein
MTSQFSIKDYLIEQKLANEEGELLESNIFPRSSDWGIGPYYYDEAMIYLCTLVRFFEDYRMLDNLNFFITKENGKYRVLINQIDRNEDYAHPNLEWNLVLETLDFLIPHMAASNISYLASQVFFNNP